MPSPDAPSLLGRLRSRLTYANVVASIALFAALGGSVYAAARIDGADIKRKSIPGNRLKPDTVRGAQVRESSLGQVRRAAVANSATTLAGRPAASFADASSIRRVRHEVTVTADAETFELPKLGHLQLTMRCNASLDGQAEFTLTASSDVTSGIDVGRLDSVVEPRTDGGLLGSSSFGVFGMSTDAGTSRRIVGTIVYNDAAETITIPFAALLFDPAGPALDCLLNSTATRAAG